MPDISVVPLVAALLLVVAVVRSRRPARPARRRGRRAAPRFVLPWSPHVWTWLSGLLLAGASLFLVQQAAQAVDGPVVQFLSSKTYFTPDGDGQEDTVSLVYCLNEPGLVDVTVLDSGKHVVRHVDSGVAQSGQDPCGIGLIASWDGKTDAGAVAPNGVYSLKIGVVDAEGRTGEAELAVGVETRVIGALQRPTPGSVVGGDAVAWSFRPAGPIAVQRVILYCDNGDGGALADTQDGISGIFGGTFDSTRCPTGAARLTASVYWVDGFGSTHGWSAPSVGLTISNAPVVSLPYGQSFFSPDGDHIEDTYSLVYCLSSTAAVGAVITSENGHVVKRFPAEAQTGQARCASYNYFEWDGKTDDGTAAPDGVYTATITAVDSANRSGTVSQRVGVDARNRGAIVAPTAGATVTGQTTWRFRPAAGVPVTDAWISCSNGLQLDMKNQPAADGTFTGEFDSRRCDSGTTQLTVGVLWVDGFGQRHGWYKSVNVVIKNGPEVTFYSNPSAFTPDGDGNEDTLSLPYCVTKPGTVTVTVANAAGTVVRELNHETVVDGDARCTKATYASWDGKNDDGRLQPDGRYTITVNATDGDGAQGKADFLTAVVTTARASIAQPATGSHISGTVAWLVRPQNSTDVRQVYISCDETGTLASSLTPSEDGSFQGTLDTTACRSGDNHVVAYVYWADDLGSGSGHGSVVRTSVVIDNALTITPYGGESYFSPDGDGQEDSKAVNYCLSRTASVDAHITNAAGQTVRVFPTADDVPGAARCERVGTVEWNGDDDAGHSVPAGVYTVHIRATSGTASAEMASRVGVDRGPRGDVVQPADGSTLAGSAVLNLKPQSGLSVTRVQFCFYPAQICRIVPAAGPGGNWRTSILAGAFPDGPQTMQTWVEWIDAFGQSHSWSAPDRRLTVDNRLIPLTVTPHGQTGPAPLTTSLDIATSDPRGGSIHYDVAWGDGESSSGDIAPPYESPSPSHAYARTGAYRAVVTVTSAAGTSATSTVDVTVSGGAANTPPTAGLVVTPASGVAPLDVRATINGTDRDAGDELTYSLDFGDGSAKVTGPLPAGEKTHTYARPGTYTARLSVSDDKVSDVKTATVVAVPDAPLAAKAGDDQVAVVNTAVLLDASASTPSAGIESDEWNFGDGETGSGVQVNHTYAQTGEYTATLRVRMDGEEKTDEVIVTVTPVPKDPGLKVTVTGGSSPLAGANIQVQAADGTRYSARTTPAGEGVLQLADGQYTVYAYLAGYLPTSATATVEDGSGELTIALSPGQVATSQLTSERLDREEIVEAGIDPDDPANNNVFEFEVHLKLDPPPGVPAIEPLAIHGYLVDDAFGRCPTAQEDPLNITCPGLPDNDTPSASFEYGDNHVSVSVNMVDDKPELVWLIVPVKARWLKEFFQIQMLVTNMAPEPFTLDHGVASLTLPEGMSLAPLTTPQTASIQVPAIAGNSSHATTWLVRGDKEGDYNFTADYSGVLEPFAEPLTIRAVTEKPIHIWGGSALTMDFDVDEVAHTDEPFYATVRLKNVADVPVYNASVELKPNPKGNYIFQPLQERTFGIAELPPGETIAKEFILVPAGEGEVNLNDSFVVKSGGNSFFPVEIKKHKVDHHYGGDYDFKAIGLDHKIGLTWYPVPGATTYKIFVTPASDQEFTDQFTPWATIKVIPKSDGALRAVVRNLEPGVRQFYAISTVIDGRNIMLHPMVTAVPRAAPASPDTASPSTRATAPAGHVCSTGRPRSTSRSTTSSTTRSAWRVTPSTGRRRSSARRMPDRRTSR